MGSLGLLALFGALTALSGGTTVSVDGDQLESATGDTEGDVLGDVTMSDGNGSVDSFSSDDDSTSDDQPSGAALRVVIDGVASSAGDSSTGSSSSSTTTTEATTTSTSAVSSSSTTTASTAPPPSESSTTSTVATTASTATTVAETTTTRRPTTKPPTTKAPTTSTTATTAAPSSNARGYEQEVIRLTNAERAAGGCGPLANNNKLHAAALGHSVDMAENDYFSHTSRDGSSMTDRIERQGYAWRRLAENIAAGYRSPAAVVDGWMNSSGHRANIMNCDLTEIGVGFHDYYWTQNFGTPR